MAGFSGLQTFGGMSASPPLGFGARARSPCTCISIQRGPTRIPRCTLSLVLAPNPASRSLMQWFVLALIAGLIMEVYYINAMVLFVLVVEAISQIRVGLAPRFTLVDNLSLSNLLYSLSFALCTYIACLPSSTFITRYIIYGNPSHAATLRTQFLPPGLCSNLDISETNL